MPESRPLSKLPLLEALAARRGVAVPPIYTNRDLANLLDVSVRTIQDWITDSKITPRRLPGRGRFLPEDIEDLLQSSGKRNDRGGSQ